MKRFQVTTLETGSGQRFQVTDSQSGEPVDLPGLTHKRTAYRDKAERLAGALNDKHVGPDFHDGEITPYALDTDMVEALYLIYVELIKFSMSAGRTETNAVRAADAAVRVIGVQGTVAHVLHRRYAKGS